MYTFLFIARKDFAVTDFELQHCAEITSKWMPSLGVKLAETHSIFPEVNCGYFLLEPETPQSQSFLNEASNERYSTLVFGDVLEDDIVNPAQAILDAWQSNGAQGVRKLEGSFSAVIIDRIDGVITLLSDLIGQRALRFYDNDDMIIVSPHELPIVATGHCPVDLDLVSVSSIAAFEHSLGGHSILQHITSCHPMNYVQWSHGNVRYIVDSIFEYDQRIDHKDSRAIRENLEQMVDTARDYTNRLVADVSDLEMTLSAGGDSRAVLALLLSLVEDPAQITAICSGETESLDVRVATRISEQCGLNFHSVIPSPAPSSEFLAHCDLLAVAANGGVNSKTIVLQPMPTFYSSPQTPIFHGAGGEAFKGAAYDRRNAYKKLAVADVFGTLKFEKKVQKASFESKQLMEMLVDRTRNTLSEYSRRSFNGHDILSMVFLYEHTAFKRAAVKRQTWRNTDKYPFYSTKLLRHAYKMPAPIINSTKLHHESIRLFAPAIYWWRVNERVLFPLENGGILKKYLHRLDQKFQILSRRWTNPLKVSSNDNRKGPRFLRADAFAGALSEIVRETILSDSSVSLKLFDRSRLNLMVSEHESKEKDHSNIIGPLISIERYYSMLVNVFHEANSIS